MKKVTFALFLAIGSFAYAQSEVDTVVIDTIKPAQEIRAIAPLDLDASNEERLQQVKAQADAEKRELEAKKEAAKQQEIANKLAEKELKLKERQQKEAERQQKEAEKRAKAQ